MVPTSHSDSSCAAHGRRAVDKGRGSVFIAVQVCLAGFILVGVYVGVIQGAWIPHRLDTFVWIKGDWQDGEYRSCQLLMPTSRLFCGSWETARQGGSLSGFIEEVNNEDFAVAFNAAMTRSGETDWTSLGKYFHVYPVLYYGQIKRPGRDRNVIVWFCQRKGDALACKAPD